MKRTIFSALVACLALCACNNVNDGNKATGLNVLGQWDIVEANGLSTDSTETSPFIHFCDSGMVNGHASVNAFFGEYILKGDSIFFEHMGATSMLGHDMDVEIAIMRALSKCATLDLQDSILKAKDNEGNVILVMKRNAN